MADQITARCVLGLPGLTSGRNAISVSSGPEADLIVLDLEQSPDYRLEQPGAPSFPKNLADRPNCFRIHRVREGAQSTLALPETTENFTFVQPLPGGRRLCVRSRAEGSDDRSAPVYSAEGRPLSSFLLGDGIQDVQVTREGEVWCS